MAQTWGYSQQDGPNTWPSKFPDAGGNRQSPINIETAQVQVDKSLVNNPLKISYQPEPEMCLGNTGASVKADVNCEDSTLSGGPLGSDVYKLIQFHLHWGSQNARGAEHTIDNKVYSAELHLVHWNSSKYKSFAEAVNKSDGLAVLCMFIKVGNSHKGFEQVSSRLNNVVCKGDQCHLAESFDPNCLLPENTKEFWTYPGSLTTPPCYESVQFILFKEVLEFSSEQLQALRAMHFGDQDSCCMEDNFRPVVSRGDRVVRASFPQN